ncbi:MAG: Zn-ribbon domain-containing OB-fold protein [Acidimicrobiales bacterium]
MNDRLLTGIDSNQVLETSINLPYSLTTGLAAGSFLAELANHRILGSRCNTCSIVITPAQDYCNRCGSETREFVELPDTGSITAVTYTAKAALILVRLDGADTDFLHRLIDPTSKVTIGARVRATWAKTASQSILDIEGFELHESVVNANSLKDSIGVEPITEVPYAISLDYRHSYGRHYGRMFDELASSRRILGSLCPSCSNVLVPPREYCDLCFVRTESHVDVLDTGILQAFSIIHLEFVGQTREPPYVYAEIVLDGSATRLIHTMGGFDIADAKDLLTVGMPVRAVWKDPADCVGTLNDIEYFEPLNESKA